MVELILTVSAILTAVLVFWFLTKWIDRKAEARAAEGKGINPINMEKLRATSRRLHAIASDPSKPLAVRFAGQIGAVNIDIIIMVFVAFMILFQFIPIISNQNSEVQASANVTTMGKFAAGLGEWMFPLFGILGLVFLLWKQKGKNKKGGGT